MGMFAGAPLFDGSNNEVICNPDRTCTPIELIETIPYSHGIAYHILRDHVSGEWLIRVIKILTEHRICGPLGYLVQSNAHTW